MKPALLFWVAAAGLMFPLAAAEYHVAVTGSDDYPGTRARPWRTIQRAASLAQPGDTITVHAGTYREHINPPRGGRSERLRITYQAARGERVEIKGSEVVKGWTRVSNDVWRVTLPNTFFGAFNPYTNVIRGDWFNPRGRAHHTGAVYLNGDWHIEAAKFEELFLPPDQAPAWLKSGGQQYLLNIAWLRPGKGGAAERIPATRFAGKHGTQNAPCAEGGDCVGFIEHGHWLRYEGVDFGAGAEVMEVRGASAAEGGVIEFRLGRLDGELLGACTVPHTGDWQQWQTFTARLHRTVSGRHTLYTVFKAFHPAPLKAPLWHARVEADGTTIHAQFPGVNPNEQTVEINVRRAVFYPDQPGRNFITVRGFIMRHAATPWAPPTAEQVGLIGTHWSKGWIIESNIISHSVCSGIALGKHGDKYDNTSADTAEGYVKTIERAHAHPIPWTRENIGHHVVRNNHISHCEQTGIVGSLGAAFSTVTGNVIHDIHVRRLFTGAEMGGIKFHAAIDTVISRNHIYRTTRGLWLDWMTQGTRVSRNLFHDNQTEDLFVEVNHGPFVVDNNLFLSTQSVLDMSQGGAYVHNLFAGRLNNRPELSRETPYHPAHSTTVAGLAKTTGGDNRFYNNIFVGNGQITPPERRGNLKDIRWIISHGLWGYDGREFPLFTGGNVYYHGAEPYHAEQWPLRLAAVNPQLKFLQRDGQVIVQFEPGAVLARAAAVPVTTALLGQARVSGQPFVNPDGSPLKVDRDYFGQLRSPTRPTPGPFERPGSGRLSLRVW